jgi:hypothetical protein
MVDNIHGKSWTLGYIDTPTEFIAQNHAIWAEMCPSDIRRPDRNIPLKLNDSFPGRVMIMMGARELILERKLPLKLDQTKSRDSPLKTQRNLSRSLQHSNPQEKLREA